MYRKFSADLIFTGQQILQDDFVLITDQHGVVIDLLKTENAGSDIEVLKGMLCPGFVNAHCHLELSHLKSVIAEGTGLVNFVQQVMEKRNVPEDAILAAMQLAEQELYNGGTVAVGDICNTINSIPVKQKSNILWHNFIEVSGFVDSSAKKRLDEMQKTYDQFLTIENTSPTTKIKSATTFAAHAPYSVSKTLFQLINYQTTGKLTTIHNQETEAENDLYKKKSGDFLQLYKNFGIVIDQFSSTGKSSLQSWLPFFTNQQSIILVHNTFTSQQDVDFVIQQTNSNQQQAFYCICINANQYIEQKNPPIQLFYQNNCRLVIGTDSYASNHQLNMMDEIKSIVSATKNTIPLNKILQWATLNGAQALQLENKLGSFEKGKKPGIVLINNLTENNISPKSTAKRIL